MANIINAPIPEIPVIIEKPKVSYINLILISFAFVLFSTGTYFLGQQSVKPVEKDEIVEVVPTTTKTPVTVLPRVITIPAVNANSTSNWKTYTNNSDRISFMYPSTYILKERDIYRDFIAMFQGKDYKLVTNDFGSKNTGSYYYLSLNIACSPADIVGDKKTLSSIKNGTIYAITGYEGPDYKTAVLKHNDLCFELNCMSENGCNDDQFSEFSRILSTFKFIENKDEKIDKIQAVEIVKKMPEVIKYLKTVPNAIIEVDHESDDKNAWVVHIYETKNSNTATYNWVDVNKATGQTTKMFDF